jgi:xylan 1,4-beta-xylosidase
VTGASRLGLAVVFDGPVLRFACRLADTWRTLPVDLDATILSDEHAARIVRGEPEAWGFTGAFAGFWVQDLGADGIHAEFDGIRYSED